MKSTSFLALSSLALSVLTTQVTSARAAFNDSRPSTRISCDPHNLPGSVTRSDENFTVAREQWATQVGTESFTNRFLNPDLISFCDTEQDVIEAVAFAKECGYTISVRSGGHSYAGLSSCKKRTGRCMQLDVSALNTFTHDGGNRVTAGVGLRLQELIDEIHPLGLVIPTGICTTVGVGGHFQSSAMGVLVKSFGMGLDHVVSFRIVLANGEIEIVTADSNPDLYWAVLGGSPGSWGVVLDYTIDALVSAEYSNSTALFIHEYPYTPEKLLDVGTKFMEISADPAFARDLFLYLIIAPDRDLIDAKGNGNYTHRINVGATWTGIDNGPLTDEMYDRVVQPLLDLEPSAQEFVYAPLTGLVNAFLTEFDHQPFHYQFSSTTLNEFPRGPAIWVKVAEEIDTRLEMEGTYSSFQFLPLGGNGEGSQVKRNAGKNAYALRDAKFVVDDWFFFRDINSKTSNKVAKRVRSMSRKIEPFAQGGIETWMSPSTVLPNKLLNFFPDSENWFARINSIKKTVDPTNLFRFGSS